MDWWTIVASLGVVALSIYYFHLQDLKFFDNSGVPYMKPTPLVGNTGSALLCQWPMTDMVLNAYNYRPDAKYIGFFDMGTPVLIIRDPELIKTIGVKNFENFVDHRPFIDEVQDPLVGKILISLRGERWREARTLLSPAFTSSKMKLMFKLMYNCAENFAEFMSKLPKEKTMMEMKDSLTRFTNDVIATCAFGVSVDSMNEPNNDFYVFGRDVTTFNFVRNVKFFFIRSWPRLSKLLKLKFVPNRAARYFTDLVSTIVTTRDEKGISRPDMIQLMMDSRGKRGTDKEITFEDMVSQAFIFLFGGFDTVSSGMCFTVHEIACNPDVQKRLQDDIDRVLEESKGEPSYEMINGMEYLSAVIDESLRMYPVAVFLDRVCTKSFELPPTLPGCKPYVLEKGRNVWVPVFELHRDPQYFEQPDKFIPDRFLSNNTMLHNTNAYLPFGLGPRMCIGNRFALLEIKVLLFHLLARCDLKICSKTTLPIRFDKKEMVMLAKGGFWQQVVPRSNPSPFIAKTVVNGHAVS